MSKTVLGVIGGIGICSLKGLEHPEWRKVHSAFGEPSDEMAFGQMAGLDIVFLPRHGRGHVHSPTSINYRANIDGLKRAGVTDIVAFSAVRPLKEDLRAGEFLIADQFIDRSFSRENSFFGDGLVAHVDFTQPVSARLNAQLSVAAKAAGIPCHTGGTYLNIEGPQFPTGAEVALYRSWNCSVAGMTALPEARLAREAELPYAMVAMINPLAGRSDDVHGLISALTKSLAGERVPEPEIESALDGAILTTPDKRAPVVVARLDAVAGRVLK